VNVRGHSGIRTVGQITGITVVGQVPGSVTGQGQTLPPKTRIGRSTQRPGNKITVTDLHGEILIEHTQPVPGVTYVGNGRHPGGRSKAAECHRSPETSTVDLDVCGFVEHPFA
jgi:hypothetical protein